MVRRSFQFLDLLVEVGIELTFHNACIGFPNLVLIQIHKYFLDVIQQFVNP